MRDNNQCPHCNALISENKAAFCPFCGQSLGLQATQTVDIKVKEMLEKANQCSVIFDRAKVLKEADTLYPDRFDINWEILFLGDIPEKGKANGFLAIKSYLLQMYLEPREFKKQLIPELRQKLFDPPQLRKCEELCSDPLLKSKYFDRLCEEFIQLFLMGSSRYMNTVFGFRIERKPEKHLALPLYRMIENIRNDSDTNADDRKMLEICLYNAFKRLTGGNTGYLDNMLNK